MALKFPRLLLAILILLNFIYFGLFATRRHLAFETGAFDTGVYAQPLYNFINGRGFAVSLVEDNGPLRWATHVEPILFPVAALYALWPDPRTLFWLQVAVLSLAALPIYALAVRRLNNEWSAVVVVLAYFLMPATQAVTLFDFHAVTMAPLFLLSAIYFLDRALSARGASFWLWPERTGVRGQGSGVRGQGSAVGRQPSGVRSQVLGVRDQGSGNSYPQSHFTFYVLRVTHYASRLIHHPSFLSYLLSSLFFLLALSTKEDISLHVFMIGAYLFFLRRRWWEGGLLMLVGLAWFYLTFQVIIPAYRTAGGQSIYAAWFETLGDTPLEIALSPFTAPDKVLALIFRPGSIPALAMITLPLGLLPWVGLPLFGLAAPSLAFSLLSQNPTLRQLETWHYAAPMLAFVMLGAIDGMARIAHYAARRRVPQRASYLTVLTVYLLIVALVYSYLRGYSHFSMLPEWPQVTQHHALGQEIAATIPAEASVLAQAQLIPYVAHREKLGIWRGPLETNYDYIWLDLSHQKFPNRLNSQGDLVIGMIYEHAFGAVAHQDGYLLLKNGAERVPLGDELFTFTRVDQPPPDTQPVTATFGDEIRLAAVKPEIHRLAISETEPQVVLYFEPLKQPAQDYYLFMYLLDEQGNIVGATDYAQPAMLWWPTSRWQPGTYQLVRVNTIPWWTGDKAAFSYAIGFSRINDPWDKSSRLPISNSNAIDDGTLLPIASFYRFAGIPYPATIRSGE